MMTQLKQVRYHLIEGMKRILASGTRPENKKSLQIRVPIINGLGLFASASAFSYGVIVLHQGHLSSGLGGLALGFVYLLIPFFNSKGWYYFSRHFLLAVATLSIAVCTVLFGAEAGFNLFYIAIVASISTLFDYSDRKHGYIALGAVLICYGLTFYITQNSRPWFDLNQVIPWKLKDSFQVTTLLNVLSSVFLLNLINRQTEHTLAETLDSIQKERDFNLGVIDHAPNLLMITDLSGQILTFNKACERATRISATEAMGRKLQDWIPELGPSYEANLKQALPERQLKWFTPPSFERTFKMIHVFTPASVNQPETILWIGEDITDSLYYQQKLKEQEKLIESSQRLAAIGEMSASIAHEINNPLAVIRLQTERLLHKAESGSALEPYRNSLIKTEEMIGRISRIIRSLQSLAGKSEQDPFEQTTLQSVVGETLELVREKFQLKQIPLRIQLDEPSLRFECRPIQISQVLVNLLNNAWDSIIEKKAREPDSKIFVEIRSECERDEANRRCIRIHVIDSGVGLNADTLQNLGQPLFSTKPRGRGMGIGLRLSQAIIESHAGSLSISSLPELGLTRFSITLPIEQPGYSALS
jgi:signal transduction histidine kinase